VVVVAVVVVMAKVRDKALSDGRLTWCCNVFTDLDPSRENLLEVLSNLSGKWLEVAGRAGFGQEAVEKMEEECKGKEAGQCLEYLVSEWLNRSPLSWSHVAEVMAAMGLKDEATQLANRKGKLFCECCHRDKFSPTSFPLPLIFVLPFLLFFCRSSWVWYLILVLGAR